MTDRPTITPPGIDAPAIHRETNPESPLPDPLAAVNGARTEAPQIKPKSKARLNREAASLAFWRAVVDASRAKGHR
jgi:hypothetical protein